MAQDAAADSLAVLVVDDDDDMRALLGAALGRRAGLHLAAAVADASAALRAVETEHFDVIVLDNHLGDGPSGASTAPALRRLAPDAVVILYTALAPAGRLEVDAVVEKPDVSRLLDVAVSTHPRRAPRSSLNVGH